MLRMNELAMVHYGTVWITLTLVYITSFGITRTTMIWEGSSNQS
jgi:hypothetical protein